MRYFLILLLAITTLAASPRPSAVAKLCGNMVVPIVAMKKAVDTINAQGCQDTVFVPLGDGYVLAYGVRVLVAE